MRLFRLGTEAWRSVVAARVSSILVVLLAGAMVAAGLLTVGRAAGAERGVQSALEDAGSRLLTIDDQSQYGYVTSTVAAQAGALSSVVAAVAQGPAQAVTNAWTGSGDAPLWVVGPDVRTPARLVSGRWPQPGEALASQGAATTLGLTDGSGAVHLDDGSTVSVVGVFAAAQGFSSLSGGLIKAAAPGDDFRSLDVVFTDAASAAAGQGDVVALLGATDAADLKVTSPRSVAEIQSTVMGGLARYNRSSLIIVLAGGGALVALIGTADVLMRRRDLGRRRALGASQSDIVFLVVARTTIAAGVGVVVTAPLVWGWLALGDTAPPLRSPVAIGLLTLIAGACGAVAPAVFASRQDPVRVLRTP